MKTTDRIQLIPPTTIRCWISFELHFPILLIIPLCP